MSQERWRGLGAREDGRVGEVMVTKPAHGDVEHLRLPLHQREGMVGVRNHVNFVGIRDLRQALPVSSDELFLEF